MTKTSYRPTKWKWLNNRGISLVTVSVAMGVGAILALTITTMIVNALRDTKNIRIISTRDMLKRNIDRYSIDPKTLELSVQDTTLSPGNQKLKYCLSGPVAGCAGFPDCCSSTETEFDMTDPGRPTLKLGGTTSAPALFDGDGEPCTGAQCVHSVVTSFIAECAGGAASCAQADGIRVSYKLQPTAYANSAAELPRMKTYERTLASLAPGTLAADSPRYSSDCSDWAVKGWPSLLECMQDGRWHVVLTHTPAGAVVSGSKATLMSHLGQGAEVRITRMVGGSPLAEICAQVYQDPGAGSPIYCLGNMRFSGNAAPTFRPSTARYGSDGSVYCLDPAFPNVNNCTGVSVGGSWYIRY
ncbi:MAG: hypothetical protein NDI61_13240 [Bdellovibrionaceae bacterium]|nr:hypothetical protein [Pseudobdellovibrionaceae bacterium]